MPHLHLPLQSGSDSVLRRMARRCKTSDFARIVEAARSQIAHFNLTTDIIVGFPGETEQEWRESLAFIEQTGFGHLHIFSYSPRSGTKAATLPGQVPRHIKKQRSQQLHGIAESMRQQNFARFLGQEFPVLWEGHTEPMANEQLKVYGYTPNYLRVATLVSGESPLTNKILPARLERIEGNHILAETLPEKS